MEWAGGGVQGAMSDGAVAGYNVLYRYSVWEAKTSCVVAAVCGTCAVWCRVPHTSDISHPRDHGSNEGGQLLMNSGLKLPSSAVLARTWSSSRRMGQLVALMDNGASNGTSCSRTMHGAIPGTYCASDAGSIGLGSEGA